MGLTVGLYGGAEIGVAGDDEKGNQQAGFGIGITWRGQAPCFIICLKGFEPCLNFLGVAGYTLLVVAEVGGEELQGEEAGLVVGVFYIYISIGGKPAEALVVVLSGLLVGGLAVAVVQDIDDLFLVVVDGIAREEPALMGVDKADIAHADIGEVDALGTPEDIEADGHADAVFLDFHLGDFGLLAGPGCHLQDDLVANRELVERLIEEELQVAVFDGLDEQLHIGIAQADFLARGIAIPAQVEACLAVPVGLDNPTDALEGRLNENEVMEVTAQGVLVGSGTVVLVAELVVALTVRRDDGHIHEWDIVPERGLRLVVRLKEGAAALFLQHDVNQCWVEVPHHIPGCVVCLGITCFQFCHRYFFSLSLQAILKD